MSAPLAVVVSPEQARRVVTNVHRSESGCWIYRGYVSNRGYGKVRIYRDSRAFSVGAHRVAYEHLKGPVPEGLELDHYRLNPGPRQAPCSLACINPAHLEPVTHRENVRRGRSPFGAAARAATCVRGHDLSGPNLYIKPGRYPKRQCRICREAARNTYRSRTGRH